MHTHTHTYRISYNKLHKNVHFSNLYKSSKQVEAQIHSIIQHSSRIQTIAELLIRLSHKIHLRHVYTHTLMHTFLFLTLFDFYCKYDV